MAHTASFESFIREEDNLFKYGPATPRAEPNKENRRV